MSFWTATRILADNQTGPDFDALIPMFPAAFFKSVGYTALAELMGGGLAGVMERSEEDRRRWPDVRGGGAILAIQVDGVVYEKAFREEVDRFAEYRRVGLPYSDYPMVKVSRNNYSR